MSYDVSVESRKCHECGRSEDFFDRNYTSNVHAIWQAVLGMPLADLDGMVAERAGPILRAGILSYEGSEELRASCRLMEPDNGWGSARGAVEFLVGIRIACEENPQGVVRISR